MNAIRVAERRIRNWIIMIWKRISMFLVNAVLCVAAVFSVAMLAATVCTTSVGVASFADGVLPFLLLIATLWTAFEYSGRVNGFVYRNEIWILMVIVLLSFLFCISILPALGQSCLYAPWDPKTALECMGKGKIVITHELRNQAWANYEVFLSLLSIVFGGTLSVAQTANAIAHTVVLYPIFALSERICGRRMARLVVLLAAFLPSVYFYAFVLNSENISSCLIMFAGYFVLTAFRRESTLGTALLQAFFAGFFLGVSHLFKGITVVFVTALFGIAAIACLRLTAKAFVVKVVFFVLLMIPMYMGTKYVAQKTVALLAGKPELCMAVAESSPLLYELTLGFNVASMGHYNHRLCQQFLKLSEEERWSFFKNRVKNDWRKYPEFMVKKFARIHGAPTQQAGSSVYFSWTFIDSKGKNRSPAFLLEWGDAGSLVFKFLFIMAVLGTCLCRGRSLEYLIPGLFSLIVILLFAGIQQLIESNGRYKISIYPFYFMVLPYMCVWFERDNPVYVRLSRWLGALKFKRRLHRENE